MKKILFVSIFVSVAIGSLKAQQWKPVSANVTFKIKMFGATVDGSLKGLAGAVLFDPSDLPHANIQATIDARTIDTDNSLRNKHLREKEDFFDVAKYPSIKMKSVKFEKTANGYLGYFDLTMKKTTKNVKMPFSFSQNGVNSTFVGSFTINRRDWEIGGGMLGMSNDVTVSITLNTQAQ